MCNINDTIIGITWHLFALQFQVEVNTPNLYDTNLSVKDEISNTFVIFFKWKLLRRQLINCNFRSK